ncbi:tryptophan-rich sensory protein [Crocinitomicaceae bacterium]|nr:tryptophan-rich sensory protein [Crocinitomicaceae bacterium]
MRALPFIIFFLANFGALAIGGFLMGEGPSSEWYQEANQAPWTPPGWVFGATWTFIMLAYTFYMGIAWNRIPRQKLLGVYSVQLIFNIGWNPVFFDLHDAEMSLLIISFLTILIWLKLFLFRKSMKGWSLLLLPYSIWLTIATSLNLYFLLYN